MGGLGWEGMAGGFFFGGFFFYSEDWVWRGEGNGRGVILMMIGFQMVEGECCIPARLTTYVVHCRIFLFVVYLRSVEMAS